MSSQFVLPKGVQLEGLLNKLRTLCWGAADILMAYSRGDQPPFGFPKVLTIHDDSGGPVSAADIAVNKWLLNGLSSEYPDISWEVLSEETAKGDSLDQKNIESDWLWILDPLDGTKDFLQGSAEYAVHLALVYKKVPILGIVLIPELEELWIGLVGYGAWCENRNYYRTQVNFSLRTFLSELILVTSKNHRNERLMNLINGLPFAGKKHMGSVGFKIASILKGESDLYISLSGQSAPKDWDLAAPDALIRSAGGLITHADGSKLKYLSKGYLQNGCLIASHGKCHEEICKSIINKINIL